MNTLRTLVTRLAAGLALAGFAAAVLGGCATVLGRDPSGDNRAIFTMLWNDVNRRYALLDVKKIDWDAVYREYDPLVAADLPQGAFFPLMGKMMSVLDDKHMRLQSSTDAVNAGNWTEESDFFSPGVVKGSYLREPRSTPSGMFTYGWLEGDVGYVFLKAFHYGGTGISAAQSWATEIDTVIAALASARVIIFDDRNNLGGLPGNVDIVASRFADRQRVYALISTKNGPGRNDFSAPVSYYVKPAGPRQFTKPVVLLTNRVTISGGEWFTLAMKALPNVIQAGGTTAGAFSLSLERQLPNGWVYSMSVQKVTDTQGVCYEGTGISPAPENMSANTAGDIAAERDPQLEAAWALARKL
jgi:carboxyl-terminal processing protease